MPGEEKSGGLGGGGNPPRRGRHYQSGSWRSPAWFGTPCSFEPSASIIRMVPAGPSPSLARTKVIQLPSLDHEGATSFHPGTPSLKRLAFPPSLSALQILGASNTGSRRLKTRSPFGDQSTESAL